jgi:hypothetical protein
MIGKLKKLRGKGLAEIADRGRQSAHVLAERVGLSDQARLPDENRLLREILPDDREPTPASALSYFRAAGARGFFNSMADPARFAAAIRSRFPDEESRLKRLADEITGGHFDLLGFRGLELGNPPDWHYEPIARKRSPMVHWSQISEIDAAETGDKKIVWELNRHQYFSVLGRAWLLTGDESYAEIWAAHIADWIVNNPPKVGVNWLSSLEIAYRSISWLWALHLFRDAPALTADLYSSIVRVLYLNGRHLETYLSTHFSPNTHLTGEALGLYFLGSFFGEASFGERWRSMGEATLEEALEFQVRDDGVYCEQATQYHRYTAEIYTWYFIIRRDQGAKISPEHFRKLNLLYDHLLYITQPDGSIPLIGDDDGGRLHFPEWPEFADVRQTMALGAAILERGDLKFAADKLFAETLWLTGEKGAAAFDVIAAKQPAGTAMAFREGGFFTARSGWSADASHIVIVCGEHGFLNCGHAHADALSFVLTLGGREIFIDPGTYVYTADAEARDRFRSSTAHNCLTVGGRSSSSPDGPFQWKTKANSTLLEWSDDGGIVQFRGTHDGFISQGVSYERSIAFDRAGSVTVIDTVESASDNAYEVNFTLAPGLEPTIEGGRCMIGDVHGTPAAEVVAEAPRGGWRTKFREVSPRYGSKVPSNAIVFEFKGAGKIEVCFTIREL